MQDAGYAYIWRYQVSPEKVPQFEELYGPQGGWVRLFSRTDQYLGTQLLESGQGWYLTVDRWASRQAHKSFVAAHQEEFEKLDRQGERLTVSEEMVGEFRVIA